MTRPWRNCNASITIANELNILHPNRDKRSDGTIGDAAHAARTSDHNPFVVVDGIGVVRARDVDKDGVPAAEIVEYLRQLGAAGDARLAGGGYLIFNERITNPDFKVWRKYTGSNPHKEHFHISFSLNRAGFDSLAPWGLGGGTTSEENELNADQARKLDILYDQVTGQDFKGWDKMYVPDQQGLTMVDLLRENLRLSRSLIDQIARGSQVQIDTTSIVNAVRDAVGQDNQDLADKIVAALAARLAS